MRILHTYLIIFIVFVVLLLVCSLTTIYRCKKHRQYRQKKKPYRQKKKPYRQTNFIWKRIGDLTYGKRGNTTTKDVF